jgi:serine/threonine-protein kinase HipA
LLNTTISLKKAKEEIALPIKGKKSNLTRNDFVDYFGKERLQLNNQTISLVLNELKEIILEWKKEIAISFLSKEAKEAYTDLFEKRRIILFIN